MDRDIQLLISGYLDGDLDDEQGERLARWLEKDAAALDRFAAHGFIHAQLLDWMGQQRLQDRLVSGARGGDGSTQGPFGWPVRPAVRPAPAQHRGPHRVRMAAAAVLLVAASISVLAYVVVSRPVIVGQLTQSVGCRWDAAQADLPVGTLLRNGQELKLLEGSALITFTSGAQMLLEAPATVRLVSAMEVELDSGRVAAKVPRHAMGFVVNSRLARFVDLGTEFTLSMDADKSFELHVFEGLVELWLDKRFGEAARWPVRVSEVGALVFDVERGDVDRIDFQVGKQMPF